MRGEDPGVPAGRCADVQVELYALLQPEAPSRGLLEDGLLLIIFATEKR